MPMPLLFDILEAELGARAAALDFLVALGTHAPMSDAQLSQLVGRPVRRRPGRRAAHLQPPLGRPGELCDARDDPGPRDRGAHGRPAEPRRERRAEPPAARLRPRARVRAGVSRTRWSASRAAPSTCSPASPGPEIIHFTHWLGALITNYEVIGTKTTPVRAVIDRAARLLDRPVSLLAPVVLHEGVAGPLLRPGGARPGRRRPSSARGATWSGSSGP